MRLPTAATWRCSLAALLIGVYAMAIVRASEWPQPPSGQLLLPSGRVVDYAIHFDRNSLQASVRVGDGLIALTSSGALLRFELPAVRLDRERIDDEVTCIGGGENGGLLAGITDGRVCRVDPTTLALTDVARLPAAPSWVGSCAAGGNRPAGIIGITRTTRPMERDGKRWNQPCSVVHDLTTGKAFALERLATTVLLDRAGRLWLGADNGEWGGHVSRVDLKTNSVTAFEPPPSREAGQQAFWHGVYGFVELADSQVWAHGGTSHMFIHGGEITRVDEGRARTLAAFDAPANRVQEPDPRRPNMPINCIIEEKAGFLVFSYNDVFRVDRALNDWKRHATLELKYRWGRPDAMSAYPAARAVHSPKREGDPYLLATIGDGYIALDGPRAMAHAIPGQLAISRASAIESTPEGTLVFEDDYQLPTWKLGAGGWQTVVLAPPLDAAPPIRAIEVDEGDEGWSRTHAMVTPNGAVYTVNGTDASPGIRVTARWANGKSVPLGRETSELETSSSFVTADGTLWNAAHYGLRRFKNARWQTVEELPPGDFPRGPIKPISADGPPWILLDRYRGKLWRLDHDAHGQNPRLVRVPVVEDGTALKIDDAIPWSEKSLLLATELGLRTYSPGRQTLSRTDLPEPPQRATALVCDGLRRVWLIARNTLWLSDPRKKDIEAFDRVPWVGKRHATAVAVDPQHADGVIVAFDSSGVAFLRVRPMP
jgi:hypothetical protein